MNYLDVLAPLVNRCVDEGFTVTIGDVPRSKPEVQYATLKRNGREVATAFHPDVYTALKRALSKATSSEGERL